jgi:hypothetical protein
MIIDAQLLFSNSQDLTGASANSTNTLDMGAVRDIGTGENLYLWVCVEVALTGASVTCVVSLQGDSTTTITPDATEQVLIIPALAAIGSLYFVRLRPGSGPLQYQYLRLAYVATGGGASLGAGTVSAGLTHDIPKTLAFPDNVTITA